MEKITKSKKKIKNKLEIVKESFEIGLTYEGEIKDGKWHGQGILIFPNGDRYEGNFENNNLNGLGTYKWSDGRIYEGHFKDGKQHGKGKYSMPDGRYFEGEFKKGKKTKKGKYFSKDGTEYIYYGCIGTEEEAPELTNRERKKILKKIIGIGSDSEVTWICNMCERKQDYSKKKYLFLNHGALCSKCFDKTI